MSDTLRIPHDLILVRDSLPDVRFARESAALEDALSSLSITDTPRLTLDAAPLARGFLGAVHRATLSSASDSPAQVVVKLVAGDKLPLLQHEATNYNHAMHLQGIVLPVFHGLYTTPSHDAAFIVLEDCGAPAAAGGFVALAGDIKLSVMRALKTLHDSGLAHGDLQPWNVLQSAKRGVRLVGLNAALFHVCPARDLAMTEEFCYREAVQELECEELVAVGEAMDFGSQEWVACG